MKRWKRLWGKIKLLHPKNLAKEVDVYGYHFSWKSHIALVLGALMGISIVGAIFQLQMMFFSVLIGAVCFALPVLILDMYKKMYEQKRFADVTAYMEQMLYSFHKTGKVIGALKECKETFADGQMRQGIERAIMHLEQGKVDTQLGIIKESLLLMEEQYSCMKLRMVHELLTGAEEYGGETEQSVLLLLEDIEKWKKRGYRLQAEKKKCHTDNVISIIVSIILCALALYILQEMQQMFSPETTVSIFLIPLIQVSSTIFLLILLLVFVRSARNLTNDWLKDAEIWNGAYLEKSYDMVVNHNEAKERRKSFFLAVPVALVMMVLFAMGKTLFGVLVLLLLLFVLMQHKVGYAIAKKDVTDALYQVLPQWLMELALLLQNNNVQVSLAKSLETTSGVLKKELQNLVETIAKSPGKLSAYTSFCEKFDLPEVTSCMKMLHAVSETGTGNVTVQMGHLLERVHEMQNRADEIQNEKIAFHMKMFFSYPVGAATVKLLMDLTLGMMVMFRVLGNMGGM